MREATAPFWRDPLFFIALSAGPVFWAMLFAFQSVEPDLVWPLRQPMPFIWLAVLYPLVEEWLFRGMLQDLVHRRMPVWQLGPLTHANILTSIAFTALHFINHAPLWAAMVFLPSLLFGFFKDRTGQVAAPMMLHIFYNSGYLWLFFIPPGQ